MKIPLITLLFSAAIAALSAQQWSPVLVNVPPANFDFQNVSVVSADVVWALAEGRQLARHVNRYLAERKAA